MVAFQCSTVPIGCEQKVSLHNASILFFNMLQYLFCYLKDSRKAESEFDVKSTARETIVTLKTDTVGSL